MMDDPDPELNIKFVKLVESHPCLYNFKLPSYNSKSEQEKAWIAVSDAIGESVEECKAKWKNVRGCVTRYVRHLKISEERNVRAVKQYYLYDAMKFVLPFTKTKKPYNNTTNASLDFSEVTAVKEESSDYYEETNSSEPVLKKRQLELPESDPLEGPTRLVYISPKEEENADLNFFKSIIPDIAGFSPRQKRLFKQRLLQIIDEIASTNDT